MGGFLSGFANSITSSMEKKHQEEGDRQKELRSFYFKALADPNTSDAAREEANTALAKLLNPETRKGYQKLQPFLEKIVGMHRGKKDAAMAGGPAGGPAAGDEAPNGTEGPIPAPAIPARAQAMAGPRFNTAMAGYGEDRLKKTAQLQREAEAEERKAIAAEIDADDTLNPAEKKEAKMRKLWGVTPTTPATLQRGIIKKKDGSTLPGAWDPKANVYYGPDNNPISPTEMESFETSASRAAPRPGDHVLGGKLRAMLEAGDELYRPDGKTLLTQEYLDALGGDRGEFRYIIRADGKQIIDPSSMSQVVTTANNQVNVTSPLTRGEDVRAGESVVGVARVPTTSTRESVFIEPSTGKAIAVPLRSTTTPVTTGGPVIAPKAPVSAAPGTPTSQVAPPRAAPVPAPSNAPPGSRELPGMRAADYNAAMLRAPAIGDAVIQAFGSDDRPTVKPIFSYIDLVKDKEATARIGNALRLTLDGINKGSGGGALHGSAGGLGFSLGSAGEWAQNALGLPAEVAAQQAQIMRDAIAGLKTDREREYYNSVLTNLATSIGLRALSGASPTGITVNAIKDELPLIGLNVTDQAAFADKGQRLYGVIQGALDFNPRLQQIWPKGVLSRLSKVPGELSAYQKGGSTKAVEGFQPPVAPKTADDFYKLHPELKPQ